MPNRIIHERATTSETLAALDDGTERHFWRLIVQADDYGYLDARAEVIRARAYPMMLSKVTELESERRTQALTTVNLLHLFTVDGKRYGHFPTWDRYQRMRSKYRKFPQVTSCDVMCRQPTTIAGIGVALNENPYPIRESLQESRIENREPPSLPSAESPPKRVTRKPEPITEDFIELMVTKWNPKLGGEERTKDTIAVALNHKAMDKYKDKQAYLNNWLRREAERYGKEHTNGTVGITGVSLPKRPQGQGDFSNNRRYEEEAHRLGGQSLAST